MKTKILSIIMLVILGGILSTAPLALAVIVPNEPETPNNPTSTEYQLLEPLPSMKGTFDTKEKGALGEYLNIIIKTIIGLSAVLAVVMIVMGGIEYMGSELISSKEEGRQRITNAIFGLLIALSAYALLNTINPDLLNSDIKIDSANVTIELNDRVPQTPVNGKYSDGRAQGAPITGQQTLPPFAKIYNNECTTVGQQDCTSTSGLLTNSLYTLSNECKCNLLITGGTETWLHGGGGKGTTHRPGSGTIDLDVNNNNLNKYFKSGKPLGNGWYQTSAGFALDEGNHWHFNPAGPH